jgi:8-oxo-dGTP pyrophosphatase MutT (NUDIX family)
LRILFDEIRGFSSFLNLPILFEVVSMQTMWPKKLAQKLRVEPEKDFQLPHETSAAVLVLFLPSTDNGLGHLLLTKRTSKVESHKGQMSFPGGFREKTDAGWLETALREAQEEVGISRDQVHVLGCLNPVLTKGAITIVPYVGILNSPYQFQVNPDEVEKIVLLPIETLLQHGLKPVEAREEHYTIQSIGISWEGELIWGATAKMLEQIHEILGQIIKETS